MADLAKLDGRVEAHLDGLRIAGEEGSPLRRKELVARGLTAFSDNEVTCLNPKPQNPMLPQDQVVFSDAARQFLVWILVRQANPASMKYVGRVGYVSKRTDCRAKRADQDADAKQLAGLVVDPTIWPSAFSAARSTDVVALWRSFAAKHGLSKGGQVLHGYALDQNRDSRHYGCVTLKGN